MGNNYVFKTWFELDWNQNLFKLPLNWKFPRASSCTVQLTVLSVSMLTAIIFTEQVQGASRAPSSGLNPPAGFPVARDPSFPGSLILKQTCQLPDFWQASCKSHIFMQADGMKSILLNMADRTLSFQAQHHHLSNSSRRKVCFAGAGTINPSPFLRNVFYGVEPSLFLKWTPARLQTEQQGLSSKIWDVMTLMFKTKR